MPIFLFFIFYGVWVNLILFSNKSDKSPSPSNFTTPICYKAYFFFFHAGKKNPAK